MVRNIEVEIAAEATLPAPRISIVPQRALGLRSLVRQPLIDRMFVSCLCLVAINILIYGSVTWLPSFMVRQGFDVASAFSYVLLMSLGGPVGSFFGAICADTVGRKRTIVGASLVAAILAGAFMFVPTPAALVVVGFLLVIPIYMLVTLLFGVYIPELFPTKIRLRAVGIANTVGRAASIVTPLIIPSLVTTHGLEGVLILMIAVLATMAAIVQVLGVEPDGRSLEELDAEEPSLAK